METVSDDDRSVEVIAVPPKSPPEIITIDSTDTEPEEVTGKGVEKRRESRPRRRERLKAPRASAERVHSDTRRRESSDNRRERPNHLSQRRPSSSSSDIASRRSEQARRSGRRNSSGGNSRQSELRRRSANYERENEKSTMESKLIDNGQTFNMGPCDEDDEIAVLELRQQILKKMLANLGTGEENQDEASGEDSDAVIARKVDIIRREMSQNGLEEPGYSAENNISGSSTQMPAAEKGCESDEETELFRHVLLSQLAKRREAEGKTFVDANVCDLPATPASPPPEDAALNVIGCAGPRIVVYDDSDLPYTRVPFNQDFSSPFSPRGGSKSNRGKSNRKNRRLRNKRNHLENTDLQASSGSPFFGSHYSMNESHHSRTVRFSDEAVPTPRPSPPESIARLPENDLRMKLIRNANLRRNPPTNAGHPSKFEFTEFGVIDTDLRVDAARLRESRNISPPNINDLLITRTVHNFDAQSNSNNQSNSSQLNMELTATNPVSIEIPQINGFSRQQVQSTSNIEQFSPTVSVPGVSETAKNFVISGGIGSTPKSVTVLTSPHLLSQSFIPAPTPDPPAFHAAFSSSSVPCNSVPPTYGMSSNNFLSPSAQSTAQMMTVSGLPNHLHRTQDVDQRLLQNSGGLFDFLLQQQSTPQILSGPVSSHKFGVLPSLQPETTMNNVSNLIPEGIPLSYSEVMQGYERMATAGGVSAASSQIGSNVYSYIGMSTPFPPSQPQSNPYSPVPKTISVAESCGPAVSMGCTVNNICPAPVMTQGSTVDSWLLQASSHQPHHHNHQLHFHQQNHEQMKTENIASEVSIKEIANLEHHAHHHRQPSFIQQTPTVEPFRCASPSHMGTPFQIEANCPPCPPSIVNTKEDSANSPIHGSPTPISVNIPYEVPIVLESQAREREDAVRTNRMQEETNLIQNISVISNNGRKAEENLPPSPSQPTKRSDANHNVITGKAVERSGFEKRIAGTKLVPVPVDPLLGNTEGGKEQQAAEYDTNAKVVPSSLKSSNESSAASTPPRSTLLEGPPPSKTDVPTKPAPTKTDSPTVASASGRSEERKEGQRKGGEIKSEKNTNQLVAEKTTPGLKASPSKKPSVAKPSPKAAQPTPGTRKAVISSAKLVLQPAKPILQPSLLATKELTPAAKSLSAPPSPSSGAMKTTQLKTPVSQGNALSPKPPPATSASTVNPPPPTTTVKKVPPPQKRKMDSNPPSPWLPSDSMKRMKPLVIQLRDDDSSTTDDDDEETATKTAPGSVFNPIFQKSLDEFLRNARSASNQKSCETLSQTSSGSFSSVGSATEAQKTKLSGSPSVASSKSPISSTSLKSSSSKSSSSSTGPVNETVTISPGVTDSSNSTKTMHTEPIRSKKLDSKMPGQSSSIETSSKTVNAKFGVRVITGPLGDQPLTNKQASGQSSVDRSGVGNVQANSSRMTSQTLAEIDVNSSALLQLQCQAPKVDERLHLPCASKLAQTNASSKSTTPTVATNAPSGSHPTKTVTTGVKRPLEKGANNAAPSATGSEKNKKVQKGTNAGKKSLAIIDDLLSQIVASKNQLTLSADEQALVLSREKCLKEIIQVRNTMQQHVHFVNLETNCQIEINQLKRKLDTLERRKNILRSKAVEINLDIATKAKSVLSSRLRISKLSRKVRTLGREVFGESYKAPADHLKVTVERLKEIEMLDAREPVSWQLERGTAFMRLIGKLQPSPPSPPKVQKKVEVRTPEKKQNATISSPTPVSTATASGGQGSPKVSKVPSRRELPKHYFLPVTSEVKRADGEETVEPETAATSPKLLTKCDSHLLEVENYPTGVGSMFVLEEECEPTVACLTSKLESAWDCLNESGMKINHDVELCQDHLLTRKCSRLGCPFQHLDV